MPEKVKVQVLGAGCRKCIALEKKIRDLAEAHGVEMEMEKVEDLVEIMKYGIMMTPGLVVNGVLKSYGFIPGERELLKWIKGDSR